MPCAYRFFNRNIINHAKTNNWLILNKIDIFPVTPQWKIPTFMYHFSMHYYNNVGFIVDIRETAALHIFHPCLRQQEEEVILFTIVNPVQEIGEQGLL
jgi:hypothetical protein